MSAPERKPAIKDDIHALYLGDNGRCFCGHHAGATAKWTGRDLSGQRVLLVKPRDIEQAEAEGWKLACERCETEGK